MLIFAGYLNNRVKNWENLKKIIFKKAFFLRFLVDLMALGFYIIVCFEKERAQGEMAVSRSARAWKQVFINLSKI